MIRTFAQKLIRMRFPFRSFVTLHSIKLLFLHALIQFKYYKKKIKLNSYLKFSLQSSRFIQQFNDNISSVLLKIKLVKILKSKLAYKSG